MVIHPKARIIAEAGPIVIGEGNLIEEQALIINAHLDNITPDTEDLEPKPMIIGTNNVFEVGCYSQAMKIGDNNVIESKAYVGRNVILTSGCIIGACCNLNTFEIIPENTVIYGADCLRRVQTERPQPQTLQLDFLMRNLVSIGSISDESVCIVLTTGNRSTGKSGANIHPSPQEVVDEETDAPPACSASYIVHFNRLCFI
ncbi:dynactin subunit 6-like [Nycticebus coucang]|uniref:dynactin subunit 6-like n=1 Tax=Nycticebus coucang TaxID=9470 RepID=UPI00234DCE81|nr:dynactin subunit 6-like [Nycticebus coucang]